MSAQWTVNEGSHAFVTVYFWDENGVAVIPTTATYRIDDVSSNQKVVAAVALPAPMAVSKIITITPAENTILNVKNRFEERRITVLFTYSAGAKTGTDEFVYAVKNLYGV